MSIYQAGIRLLIVIGIIISLYSGDFDYTPAITLLAIIYFFSYVLIPKGKNTKYLFLLVDIAFLSIGIYFTGNSYLVLFLVPLFTEFVRESKEIVYFLFSSAIPLYLALYTSNFSDLSIPLILAAGFFGIAGLYLAYKQKDKYFEELKNDMENMYIKNISFQEKIEQIEKKLRIYNFLETLRERKFPLKLWIYDLNELLGTDGIILFDFEKNKCFSTGNVECNKDILKYIEKPFQKFENTEINHIFNAPYIYSVILDDGKNPVGAMIFISKLKDINPDFIKIVKEQLTLYFLESNKPNSEEES